MKNRIVLYYKDSMVYIGDLEDILEIETALSFLGTERAQNLLKKMKKYED